MRLNGCENESGPRRSRSGRPHRRYGSCSHRWLRWRCCCRRPQTRSCHCRRRWTDQAMIRPPPAGAATDPRRPGTRPRCSTRTLSTIESNDGSASRPLGSAVRSLCILVRKASSSASARAASRTAPRLRRTGSSASKAIRSAASSAIGTENSSAFHQSTSLTRSGLRLTAETPVVTLLSRRMRRWVIRCRRLLPIPTYRNCRPCTITGFRFRARARTRCCRRPRGRKSGWSRPSQRRRTARRPRSMAPRRAGRPWRPGSPWRG
jgi:hypothetical protein